MLMHPLHLPKKSSTVVIYFVGSAWFCYSAAEGFGLSGIIANLASGTMFKLYGAQHLEHEGVEEVSLFTEVLAHMCDTMVFILCGIAVAFVNEVRICLFAISGLVGILVGRFLSTAGCALLVNQLKVMVGAP